MDAPDSQPRTSLLPDGRLLLEGRGCRLILGLEGPRPQLLAAREAAGQAFASLQPRPILPSLAFVFGHESEAAAGACLADALVAALPEVPIAWAEHAEAVALRLAPGSRLRLALGEGSLLCLSAGDGVGGAARHGPALVLAARAAVACLAARALAAADDPAGTAERWVGRGLILGAAIGGQEFGLAEAALSKLDEPAGGPT